MTRVKAFPRKTYRTKRLALRPYTAADYAVWEYANLNRAPKQNRFDRGPLPKSKCNRVTFNQMMRKHKKLADADKLYVYGVFEKSSGACVGSVDIFVMVRDAYQIGNLGYQIHNRHWRKGFGAEAALAALKIAFRDLKLHRIEASAYKDNRASLELARSIGMHNEGIKRRYLYENRRWNDLVVYAINPEDLR